MTRTKRRSKEPYQIQGVDALFGKPLDDNQSKSKLALLQIQLPDTQPRRYFEPKAMEDLVESIKAHGLLQPILVRPLDEIGDMTASQDSRASQGSEETSDHAPSPIQDVRYELVAGERRYRAARSAGLHEVPVVIRKLSQEEAFQLALMENLQREDLNPVEETEAILQLLTFQLKLSNKEVIELFSAAAHPQRASVDNVIHSQKWQHLLELFRLVGKFTPDSFRTNRLPLLKLPQDILEPLRQGKIEYTKAKTIARIKDETARKQLIEEAIASSLSLSQLRERVKEIQPNSQKEEILNRLDNTYKQVKKSKKSLLSNPKKRKKLDSLLAQIEKLLEAES